MGRAALARPEPARARAARRRSAARPPRRRRRPPRGEDRVPRAAARRGRGAASSRRARTRARRRTRSAPRSSRAASRCTRGTARSPDEFHADLLAVADTEPEIVVDDGCELTARIVEHRPEVAAGLAGVTEETTTGISRLRALERRRPAHVPGDRGEQRALQAPLRQPLRHRPVDARCHRPAHEPQLRRARVLHRRLRLGRQGPRALRPRPGRPRHRRRGRPGRRPRGAHGRPSRRARSRRRSPTRTS